MIIVEIHKNISGQIESLTAADHSGYAEEGNDIVCAGASTLMYTAIGALQEICGLEDFYRILEGSNEELIPFSEIILPVSTLSKEQLHDAQIILRTVEIGFLQLEESIKADYGNQFI